MADRYLSPDGEVSASVAKGRLYALAVGFEGVGMLGAASLIRRNWRAVAARPDLWRQMDRDCKSAVEATVARKDAITELVPGKYCYYIDSTQDTSVHGGFVPSIVVECEAGHYPMIGDPKTLQAPWVWGSDLETAEAIAASVNEGLGLTEADVVRIVASSMRAQNAGKELPR